MNDVQEPPLPEGNSTKARELDKLLRLAAVAHTADRLRHPDAIRAARVRSKQRLEDAKATFLASLEVPSTMTAENAVRRLAQLVEHFEADDDADSEDLVLDLTSILDDLDTFVRDVARSRFEETRT